MNLGKLVARRIIFFLSRIILSVWTNRSIEYKAKYIMQIIRDFKIDGMVIHSDRSCKPQTLGQHEMSNLVREKAGIPVLIIDADSMDPRYFSESQVTTRVEAFMESMDMRKRDL
jgi:benzoyl-CoA reductase/2-hydroxyglutaryl-CoA dehydratase subunit BcrC/BadD/HgdB